MKPKKKQLKPSAVGCVCMQIRKAARRVTQIYDQHLESYGVTATQFGIVSHVDRFDGIGIGVLAEMLRMDPTTLTRSLEPLQRRRIVAVKPDPADGRLRRLHLTAAGRRKLAEARPAWERAQSQIIAALGVGATGRLNDLLDRTLSRLD